MAIKIVLHRVLIKPDKFDERDSAYRSAKALGIEIVSTEAAREQKAVDTGVVVSIGPTAFKDFGVAHSPIAVGDTVVYAKYGGKAVVDPEDGAEYVALNDEDIIAITEGASQNG